MNAIGYTRVSTDEQATEGHSLAAQELAIEKYADEHGWELVRVFSDEGKTGRTVTGRDGLAEARALLREGKAEVLIVSAIDRLARSMPDFAQIAAEAQTHGWNLAVMGMGLDSTTPHGKLTLNILAAMAEWESEMIGARTRAGMAQAKREGKHLGRPPEVAPALLKRINDLRADGLSWFAIEKLFDEQGVTGPRGGRLDRGTLRKMVVRRQ